VVEHSLKVPNQDFLTTRLETFFPFDPLVLPRVKLYIDSSFQEWDSGDESENEDSMDPSDSDLGASLKGMSLDDRLSLPMSLSLG
jgi:hypothetical protein